MIEERAAYLFDISSYGEIDERQSKDKWGNDISQITLTSGEKFSMIHLKSGKNRLRRRIYNSSRKFINVEIYCPDDDCVLTSIDIAGYKVYWGDGENNGVICNPAGPNLTDVLREIREDDFDAVILVVLSAIKDIPMLWNIIVK